MAIERVRTHETGVQAQPAPEGALWRDVWGLLAIPPLNSGDRLTRREFERRYAAMPTNAKCELIEGVVYVASPVRVDHARPHSFIMWWLNTYLAATPGMDVLDNVSVRLDADNEVQPDAVLRCEEKAGGKSRVVEGILRSRNFPGLCLPVNDMVIGNHARVLAVLQQGLSTPDHEAFVKTLAPANLKD